MDKLSDKPFKKIEKALDYLKQGYSVIPLYGTTRGECDCGNLKCTSKGKHPAMKAWKMYQVERAPEEQIKKWFLSNCNVGIITGKLSGITVLDLDNHKAFEFAARQGGLDNTPWVKTGKGYHFYYQYEEGHGNFVRKWDGIDLRAEGGLVVAPPSIHVTGTEYTWEGFGKPLRPLPSWVIEMEKVKTKQSFRDIYKGVNEGSRNDTLARLAGLWVKSLPLNEAIEMAYVWNSQNTPPMDNQEVETTVKSIYSAELRGRTMVEKPVSSTEYVSMGDLGHKIFDLYETGYRQGESTGWSKMDEFYKIRKGEWTLITGQPSHGKSAWLDAMMCNIVGDTGWNFAIFSAENLPLERHAAGIISCYVGKPFDKERSGYMAIDELKKCHGALSDRFIFIKPNEDDCTIERILKIAQEILLEKNISAIVIDPWNELNHAKPTGVTSTEYVSQILSKVRRFARINDIHVFLVAHPVKLQKDKDGKYPVPTPYEVSDSAHWRNKADNCIAVWRDVLDVTGKVQVHIQKIRFRENGKPGLCELWFDWRNSRYAEYPIYQNYQDR